MALETSVDENKWKFMSDGTNPGSYSSNVSYINSSGVRVEKLRTTFYTETSEEYKYYALTESAATTYKTNNPTLDLTVQRQNEFGAAFDLVKRVKTRTITGYTLVDVTPVPT